MRHLIVVCLLAALPGPGWAQTPVPVPVDGIYDGTASLQSGSAKHCDQSFTFKLRVHDRIFNWTLRNQNMVPVPVAPDGSFSMENGERFLNGRIDGTRLVATTTGRGCSYSWAFSRE